MRKKILPKKFAHPLVKDLMVEKIPGGSSPFFYHPFISYFTPLVLTGNVVDLGCGKGINGFLIRASRYLHDAKVIGLEINEDYINFCKQHNIYNEIIKKKLPILPFKNKTIELIICTEVIEHLTRKDGTKLLDEIDRTCNGRAIVSTPNIFFETMPGDSDDRHLSLWTVEDFKSRGYKVYGLGVKMPLLWGDKFLKIKQALYYFFTPISYLFPYISGSLIAIKDF
jgi:2-polyprenyl-3-methyl-5-hydroxy-6-metoxy-1,4-benzoquinol methylase